MGDESQPWHWMGTTEVATYLGLSLRTVYRLIDTGEIPAFQLGRVIRCRRHEVDEYLERAKLQPGTITERHRDVGKGAWTWTSTEEKQMRAGIDAFVSAVAAGEPASCLLCRQVVGQADLAKHMLAHRS